MEIEPYDQDESESEEERIDEKDYEGALLDDVYNDMKHAQHVEWPNDAYWKLMEITTRYQLSNSTSDAMIYFFNKFSNLDNLPLPVSIQIGKKFLDSTNIRYNMFKEIFITTFQNIEYTLYYRPVIQASDSG